MANFESQGTKIFWDDGTVAISTGTTADSTDADKLIGQITAFNGPSGAAAKIPVTGWLSKGMISFWYGGKGGATARGKKLEARGSRLEIMNANPIAGS